MFKQIDNYAAYEVDGQIVIILSKNYKGRPIMMYKYDVLIGDQDIIERYKQDLFPDHLLKQGWIPKVRYL